MSRTSIPKIFMGGGLLGFSYYLYMRQYWFPNPYKTAGVNNIEDRYTAGGGQANHQPAAATPRGDSKSTETSQLGPSKGPDSEHFDMTINDQKPQPPGIFSAQFYKNMYDNVRGK